MGIRFYCPNGHKLNVKSFQAGQRGICPSCGAKVQIPERSTRPSSKQAEPSVPQPRLDASPDTLAPPAEVLLATPAFPSQAETFISPPATPISVAKPAAKAVTPAEMNPAGPVAAAMPNGPQPTTPAVPSAPGALRPAVDPLSEDPELVWYVRPPAGGQYGPATSPVLRTWLAEGRVPPDSLIWREGWQDWRSAAGVFPQLRSSDEVQPVDAIAGRGLALPRAPAAGYHDSARSRSHKTNVVVIVLLAVAAIVLLAVFVWVLMNGPELPAVSMAVAGPVCLATRQLRRFWSAAGARPS